MLTTILNGIIHCFNFISFKNYKEITFLILLLIICCKNIASAYRPTDYLPIVDETEDICRPVKSNDEDCGAEEELSWEVQYQTHYHDYFKEGSYENEECRIKCWEDPECIMVANRHSPNKCYLINAYKYDRQYSHNDFQFFMLSCCEKVTPKYQTTKFIDKSVCGELCQHIEKRSKATCRQAVYVKHKGQYSQYSDTRRFKNVSLKDCIRFCNEEGSCVLFNYNNNGECHLKHLLGQIHNFESDLYVLSCFPKVKTTECTSCKEITNRNTKCESSQSPVWSVASRFKQSGRHFKTQTVTLNDCLDVCVLYSSCLAISYNNVNKECDLHEIIGELQSDNESEYAVLKCDSSE